MNSLTIPIKSSKLTFNIKHEKIQILIRGIALEITWIVLFYNCLIFFLTKAFKSFDIPKNILHAA